jgi:hypothetical protein
MQTTSFALSSLLAASASAAQGPCCLPLGSGGCADALCAERVCTFDPYCCSTLWDERCASEASVLCEACRPPESCNLPPAHRQEWEPCGSGLDAACPVPEPLLMTLAMGDVLHGTVWATDTGRDVDWFVVELNEPAMLAVDCWSAGPIGVAIVDAACPPAVHAESADGCPARAQACLPAGAWRVVVRPLLFEPLSCQDPRAAYAIQATVSPCQPHGLTNDACTGAIPAVTGANAFDTTHATADPQPLPGWCDEGAGLAITHDAWFEFTPLQSGLHRLDTCTQIPFDTRLAVLQECDGPVLACSDDHCAGDGAELEVMLQQGVPVLVRLGGWGHGGAGVLHVEPLAGSAPCPGDLDANGMVDAGDIGSLLLLFGSAGGPADLDESGTVDAGDIGLLLLWMGPCPAGMAASGLDVRAPGLDWTADAVRDDHPDRRPLPGGVRAGSNRILPSGTKHARVRQ